jgi:hypothetical protein
VSALIRADSTSFKAAETVAMETPAAVATSEIRTLPGMGETLAETFQHSLRAVSFPTEAPVNPLAGQAGKSGTFLRASAPRPMPW